MGKLGLGFYNENNVLTCVVIDLNFLPFSLLIIFSSRYTRSLTMMQARPSNLKAEHKLFSVFMFRLAVQIAMSQPFFAAVVQL